MYKIKLTARVRREIKQISKSHQVVINEIFDEIKDNPLIGKPLTRELIRRFSYKVSVYRIIYTVNKKDKIVTIITVGHRSVVYKQKHIKFIKRR